MGRDRTQKHHRASDDRGEQEVQPAPGVDATHGSGHYPGWDHRGAPLFLVQVSVCLFGLLVYALSYFPSVEEYAGGSRLLQQIGIGVLVFGLTALTLARYDARDRVRQLETIADEVKSVTTSSLDLVHSAQESGIDRVYPFRTGDESWTFRDRLRDEFEKARREAHASGCPKIVRMMGISLRGFFFQNGELHTVTDDAFTDPNLRFEILLIDPYSEQAVMRSERESQREEGDVYTDPNAHFVSTLFTDMQNCTRYLQSFTLVKSPRVEVRFYRAAPSCFLVFVNDSVFVETYHYGRSGVGGLRGGRVPVLEFYSHTETYKELEGHFDYVWFKSKDRVLDAALANEIMNPPASVTLVQGGLS